MITINNSKGFEGFDGREEVLQKIIRYNMPQRTPMFYRTNLLLHSKRVNLLVNDVAQIFKQNYRDLFDVDKALTLALVHDDAEIVTGDVQLYYKERMSPEQLKEVANAEARAIEVLANRWPKDIKGFNYRSLLLHALNKDCLEAQVVSYCDKIDAYCEALHEVFAGNYHFNEPAVNYVRRINELPVKFPFLKICVPFQHPLLSLPQDVDVDNILQNGTFHTSESIGNITGLSHYDRWKELTIYHLGIECLVTIKER